MPPEPRWDDPLAVPVAVSLGTPALPGRLHQRHGRIYPLLITLDFGQLDSGTDPFVSVAARPSKPLSGSTRIALLNDASLLFQTRLAAAQESVPEGGPEPSPAGIERSLMRIGGIETACLVHHRSSSWTALAYLPAGAFPPAPGWPGTLVTVAARGIALADISLVRVTDLEPFRSAARGRPQNPEQSPPQHPAGPAQLNAIEQLVRAAIKESPDPVNAPREAHRWISELQVSWTAAHQAQMHFANQPPAAAANALTGLVEQIKDLSAAVQWWREAGPDAVLESIRHAVFASDVASRHAQELWDRGIVDATNRRQWLNAWEQWYRLWRRRKRKEAPREGPLC